MIWNNCILPLFGIVNRLALHLTQKNGSARIIRWGVVILKALWFVGYDPPSANLLYFKKISRKMKEVYFSNQNYISYSFYGQQQFIQYSFCLLWKNKKINIFWKKFVFVRKSKLLLCVNKLCLKMPFLDLRTIIFKQR